MADSDSRNSSPSRDVNGRVSEAVVQKCPKCNHYIQAGSVNVEGKYYHPKCFVCMKCGTTCRLGSYQRVNDKFYCQNCVDKTPELYQSLRAAKQKKIEEENARKQALLDEENARLQAIIDAENARQQAIIDEDNARIAAELEEKNKRSLSNMFRISPSKNKSASGSRSGSPEKIKQPDMNSQVQETKVVVKSNPIAAKPPMKAPPLKAIPPSLPTVPAPEETVPEDIWVEVKDENTGKMYWWNQETNETTALDAPKPTGHTARGETRPAAAGACCIIN